VKAAVVGMGSIGARHARILQTLGCEVSVVSRRPHTEWPVFGSLEELLQQNPPEYLVIANGTAEHRKTLEQLAKARFTGTVLVEKPLFEEPMEIPGIPDARVFVGYNLRFHPIFESLHARLQTERVLSVQVYVGQYLPDWRPGTDYTQSYSASRARGGGVLRDLSHELDYLCWLLGPWQAVAAVSGQYGSLDIDSEDTVGVLLETSGCPVISLQMNYLDRVGRREIIINTDGRTLKADLVAGELIDGHDAASMTVSRDYTYRAQHEAIMGADPDPVCTVEEGLETVRLIAAIEKATKAECWVRR